ncbi:hypothetical protein MNB_SUP05-SYMBIONT-5-392 [hydrothermal vent metagenome]|uniref:Lipoprotein n=1 Tax=hydrothermal vent metagenome TaxID=652676 RepID=A0A1W1E755_9ZZZZ
MKKHFLIYTLTLIFLTACSDVSGGSGGNNPNLPPDPGKAGKLTIEGIDSDNDGVRDDVQIAIYERHPNAPEKRAALEQQAKAYQKALIAGEAGDTAEIFRVTKEMDRAQYCILEMNGGIQNSQAREETRAMDMKILNTDARNNADMKYNQALSGNFFSVETIKNPCDN